MSPAGRFPLVALVVALAVLGGISTIAYLSLQGMVQRMQWVVHTQEVLRETEMVLSDLKDVETGIRGYLISGQDELLAPYLAALANLPRNIAQLKQLTADNPYQQERVKDLEQLIGRRFQQAASALRLARTAKTAIPESVRSQIQAGKSTMDEVRALAGDMRGHEESLLAQRIEESERSTRRSAEIIVFGTLASFAILVAGFILLRREMAQRTQAERAAHEHANEVENLYNHAPCGYHSVDRNGVFLRMNDTELAWLGYRRDEIIGKLKFADIVAPEYAQTAIENLPRLVSGGATTNLEYRLVRKDGSTFPVSVNALPVLDVNGNYVMSRTTMFDITAMKETESRLRMAHTFLDALVDNIPSMIFVKDAQTLRFARINKAEEKFLGISRHEMIGKTDHDLFPADQADFFVAKDREVLQGSNDVHVFEEQLTTAGVTRYLRTRKLALLDPAGRPQYLLGISDDITEQKRAEEAIRALNSSLQMRANQLEAANKELESFSYSVSHDLRAPLRAIDGFTRIFQEDYGATVDDEGRRLLKVVRDNSERMGVLIDDLLAFSRLGRQPLACEPVDMNALVEEALAQIRNAGSPYSAQVAVQPLPAVKADAALLRQVWINLLSNALKYSSVRTSPEIKVGFIAPADPHDHVTYFVKDNGVGFDMRYYEKLFGVFQRLHSIEEFSGTGVGLAIVHRLITRHGGRVWAEAELDKGAAFFFSLPMETTA